MSKINTFENDNFEEEKLDPQTYLRTLSLEDFLNCNNTHEILLLEHRDNFEKILKSYCIFVRKRKTKQMRSGRLRKRNSKFPRPVDHGSILGRSRFGYKLGKLNTREILFNYWFWLLALESFQNH